MMTRRGILTLTIMAIATSGLLARDGLPPMGELPSKPLPQVGVDQKLGDTVPLDLILRDEKDQKVVLKDLIDNKPTVLVLAYYRCPMLCNQVLNGLLDSMRAINMTAGREFNVVVVSFDPKEHGELASRKKETYLRDYGREGAEKGWHFLTGDRASIDQLAQAVGFRYEYDRTIKEYAHPSAITVLTREGVISKYLLGIKYDDLKLAILDSSGGKIGSLADQIMLLCYRYDHTAGKYSFNVMLVVRTAGALTLFLLVTGLLIAFRRDRRKARETPVPTLAKEAPSLPLA